MSLKDLIKSSSGGARSAKFETPGTVRGGVVVSSEVFQTRDDDGKPETWEDGGIKQQIRIIVQTDLDEGTDDQGRADDGKRTVYIKWWGDQKKIFIKAIQDAGADDVVSGGKFFAKYVGDGEKVKKQWSAPKIMKYKYVAPPSVPVDEFTEEEIEEEAPAKPVAKSASKKPAPTAAETDLSDMADPVDDTAAALSEAGLDADF